MFNWLKLKYKQLTCKHLLISDKPYMDPETWEMINECGKCGHEVKYYGLRF